jgi:hypothetical protein
MRKHVQWNPVNDWISFREAAWKIEKGLSVSAGCSEAILQNLRASGDVRVIQPRKRVAVSLLPGGMEFLDCENVSAEDVDHWLTQQKTKSKAVGKRPALGKRPRIKRYLAEWYPAGVPDPAHCPRKALKGRLLEAEPGLKPLDEGTLKTAIDEYNRDIRNDPN